MVICPVCSSHITHDQARFCQQCGYRIVDKEEHQSAADRLKLLGGEVRLLTVFFVNFTGFDKIIGEHAEASTMLDIRSCLNETDDIIKKMGGTANQILPDMRVLGIFGAPKAHSDDPLRAVRCAWRIRSWWEEKKRKHKTLEQVNIGIGVNTGSAFFGYILEKAAFLTVIGDTINTAARLTEICPASGVLLTEMTHSRTSDITEYDHIGGRSVKGKAGQIDVYSVRAVKDVSAAPAQMTPYVGRKEELGILVEHTRSMREQKEQFCIISGQMGIGKSRLKEEFIKHLALQDDLHYFETHCSSEVRSPYYPFKFLLRRYFCINEYDAPGIVEGKMTNALTRTGLSGDDMEGLKHLFFTDVQHLAHDKLLSINDEIYRSVRNLIRYECSVKPLVLIFEEFNRADAMSKSLVAYLATELAGEPVMFLMVNVSRDFLKDIAVEIQEISLQPLPQNDVKELITAILEEAEEKLVDFIYQSGGGNPLFTIEAIRNTQRTNIIRKVSGRWQLEREQRLSFLDDLYGVVMSTIDSLPADYRLIIDFASVIGYSFSARILTRLFDSTYLNEQLHYLIEEGYIVLTQEGQDPTYIFRHNLLKDAAYTVIPLRKRREIHARVGELFEELYADRLSEFYEEIGHHYQASENYRKAAYYFLQAGNKAKNLFAIDQALSYYTTVLKLEQDKHYETSDEERQDIFMNLADIYEILGDIQKMARYAEQGLDIARARGQDARVMDFRIKRARALQLQNDYTGAEEILLMLIEQGAEKRRELLPKLYSELGFVYQCKYEYEKSMINYNLSWNTARAAEDAGSEVSCLFNLAELHKGLGNYEQALEYIEYCLDERLAPEEKRWRTQFAYLQSEVYYRMWDLAKATSCMDGCHAQADELGYTEYYLRSSLDLAHLKLLREGDADIKPYIDAVDKRVSFLIRQHLLTGLNYKKALLFFLTGDQARAKDYVTSALVSSEQMGQKDVTVYGRLLLSSIDGEKAIDHAMQALDIADTVKLPPLIGEALYRLTEIYKARSDMEKARYYGRKALLVYDDIKFKLHQDRHEAFSRRPEYVTLLEV